MSDTPSNVKCYPVEELAAMLNNIEKRTFRDATGKQAVGMYCVYNPKRGKPAVLHKIYEDAYAEAKRLSRKHPDEDFYVMSVVRHVSSSVLIRFTIIDHTGWADEEASYTAVSVESMEKFLRGLYGREEHVFPLTPTVELARQAVDMYKNHGYTRELSVTSGFYTVKVIIEEGNNHES